MMEMGLCKGVERGVGWWSWRSLMRDTFVFWNADVVWDCTVGGEVSKGGDGIGV